MNSTQFYTSIVLKTSDLGVFLSTDSAESVGMRRPFVDFFANIRDNLDVYETV